MKPAKLDLFVKRGDTFEVFFRVRERVLVGSEYVDGDYVNLTGWTGLCQVRQSEDAATIDVEISVVIADQVASLGGVFMRLTAAQTTALTIASGKYDLQFTKPDTTVHTFLEGTVTVSKDYSRAV